MYNDYLKYKTPLYTSASTSEFTVWDSLADSGTKPWTSPSISDYSLNYSALGEPPTLEVTINTDHSTEEIMAGINKILGRSNTTKKETATMEPKKMKNHGNGLYANPSLIGGMFDIGTIYGDHLYLDLTEWDGNITQTLRLITKTYGWLERHAYFKLRDAVTQAHRVRIERKEREQTLKHAKTFKVKSPIRIEKVKFDGPATIVFWSDDTKTVVKCGENDKFDREKGLAMAISKKMLGNEGNYFNEFKRWLEDKDGQDNGRL